MQSVEKGCEFLWGTWARGARNNHQYHGVCVILLKSVVWGLGRGRRNEEAAQALQPASPAMKALSPFLDVFFFVEERLKLGKIETLNAKPLPNLAGIPVGAEAAGTAPPAWGGSVGLPARGAETAARKEPRL